MQTNTSALPIGGAEVNGTQTVYIYALKCPDTLTVRYVGKSINPKQRLKQHLLEARAEKGTHKNRWLNQLITQGKMPLLSILEATSNTEWQERERFHIKQYKGQALTNASEGGEGFSSQDAKSIWLRPGYKERQIKKRLGRTHSSETRSKQSQSHTGKKQSSETISKRVQKLQGKTREHAWNSGKTGVYSEAFIVNNRLQKSNKGIERYTECGEFKDSFPSIRGMCRELGWSQRHVQRSLKKGKSLIYGFVLKQLPYQ